MNRYQCNNLKKSNVIFDNTRLFNLACLLFFSCYTLTPLYNLASIQGQDNDRLPEQSRRLRNIRMLLWDLVISKLTHEENSTTCPVNVHFLLKKRRAVLNSGIVPEIFQQSSKGVRKDLPLPFILFIDVPPHIPRAGHYSQYSGLSPPVHR